MAKKKTVVAVELGHEHSLALTDDGKVWAWGANAFGQLGDGSLLEKLIPMPVALP